MERSSQTMGIAFLQMGGPSSLSEVKPFLTELFKDPDLIRFPRLMRPFQPLIARLIAHFRTRGTQEMYSAIGNGSPILGITESFVKKVDDQLRQMGMENHVTTFAMRYTPPRATDAARILADKNVSRLLLFPLYPHFSHSTSGSSFKDMERALQHLGIDVEISKLEDWSTADFYINWWVRGLKHALEKLPSDQRDHMHVIFSAHGLPKKYISHGDPYHDRVKMAAETIMTVLDEPLDWTLAFQSRVGPLEWLRPYTDETIEHLAENGIKSILVVPLGFVSDHIETLYEIDILYHDLAKKLGVHSFVRVPVPNDDLNFAKGVARFIQEVLNENVS